MTMYLYRGPGHRIEIDDVVVNRDEPVELSDEQVSRVRVADPSVQLEEAPPEKKRRA
jgi:hypothetical protein